MEFPQSDAESSRAHPSQRGAGFEQVRMQASNSKTCKRGCHEEAISSAGSGLVDAVFVFHVGPGIRAQKRRGQERPDPGRAKYECAADRVGYCGPELFYRR